MGNLYFIIIHTKLLNVKFLEWLNSFLIRTPAIFMHLGTKCFCDNDQSELKSIQDWSFCASLVCIRWTKLDEFSNGTLHVRFSKHTGCKMQHIISSKVCYFFTASPDIYKVCYRQLRGFLFLQIWCICILYRDGGMFGIQILVASSDTQHFRQVF